MKRILSTVLLILLIPTLFSCGYGEPEDDYYIPAIAFDGDGSGGVKVTVLSTFTRRGGGGNDGENSGFALYSATVKAESDGFKVASVVEAVRKVCDKLPSEPHFYSCDCVIIGDSLVGAQREAVYSFCVSGTIPNSSTLTAAADAAKLLESAAEELDKIKMRGGGFSEETHIYDLRAALAEDGVFTLPHFSPSSSDESKNNSAPSPSGENAENTAPSTSGENAESPAPSTSGENAESPAPSPSDESAGNFTPSPEYDGLALCRGEKMPIILDGNQAVAYFLLLGKTGGGKIRGNFGTSDNAEIESSRLSVNVGENDGKTLIEFNLKIKLAPSDARTEAEIRNALTVLLRSMLNDAKYLYRSDIFKLKYRIKGKGTGETDFDMFFVNSEFSVRCETV